MAKRTVSSEVRQELVAIKERPRDFCAYLSGVIRGAGELVFTFKGFALTVRHTDESFVKKTTGIINELTGEEFGYYDSLLDLGYAKKRLFTLNVPVETAAGILEKCHIVRDRCELVDTIPIDLIKSSGERKAYLRGLFLACGYLAVPQQIDEWVNVKTKSGYGMEFNLNSSIVISDIKDLLTKTARLPKDAVRVRTKSNVLYVRNSDALGACLTAIGSIKGTLALNEIIAERQMKNDVNRANNFDVANIYKSVSASEKQLADIDAIERVMGLDSLPVQLAETCNMRKNHPDAGLEALGLLFDPPVGKSGINHRMRKIAEYAEEARKRESKE